MQGTQDRYEVRAVTVRYEDLRRHVPGKVCESHGYPDVADVRLGNACKRVCVTLCSVGRDSLSSATASTSMAVFRAT